MGKKKAKKDKDEQHRSEVDPVEARAYAENPEIDDDDPEESQEFQALDEGEKAMERNWEKHLAEQSQASDKPPAEEDEPETAEGARGEESQAKAEKEPETGPSGEETPGDQDVPKYGGGRYNTMEDFEKGHQELRKTLTQVQQEKAALQSQIANAATGGQQAQPNQGAQAKDILGGELGGKVKALMADEEFQRLLDVSQAEALPKLLEANTADILGQFMAVLSVADAQTRIQTEHAQAERNIVAAGNAYMQEKHKVLLDEKLEPLVTNIGHKLLGTNLPDNALSPDQIHWRQKASSGPEGLHEYLDKVAAELNAHPLVNQAGSQPSEKEEDLHLPKGMRPGSTTVPNKVKTDETEDFDDFAEEQKQSAGLWG